MARTGRRCKNNPIRLPAGTLRKPLQAYANLRGHQRTHQHHCTMPRRCALCSLRTYLCRQHKVISIQLPARCHLTNFLLWPSNAIIVAYATPTPTQHQRPSASQESVHQNDQPVASLLIFMQTSDITTSCSNNHTHREY